MISRDFPCKFSQVLFPVACFTFKICQIVASTSMIRQFHDFYNWSWRCKKTCLAFQSNKKDHLCRHKLNIMTFLGDQFQMNVLLWLSLNLKCFVVTKKYLPASLVIAKVRQNQKIPHLLSFTQLQKCKKSRKFIYTWKSNNAPKADNLPRKGNQTKPK